jgi:DNA topoisomerase-1
MEKNRVFAEESGRLLTAFLERFFPNYVAYDFTAGMEDELDVVSDGREDYKALLARFWKDFKPKADEVMEKMPSEVTEALDEYLSDFLFPPREDGSDPRACPLCGSEGRANGRLSLRGGRFGAFVACANYPECKFTRRFAQPGGEGGADDGVLGQHPETGEDIHRKTGRFGAYVQMGDGKDAKRASIPKDLDDFDLDWAVKLLGLPRIIGAHPDTGLEIEANIGRYGPYLRHDGKYGKLTSTREVFEVGMNRAVDILAQAANRGAGGAGRGKAEAIATLGAHPVSGGEIKVMPGRYGPYVTDGTTNATIPRDVKPEDVTLEAAIALIDARVAKGPAKGAKKGGAKKKAAPKKAAAKKKAPAKKKASAAK